MRAAAKLISRSAKHSPQLSAQALKCRSRPTWETYRSMLDFAESVRRDQRDLKPRDMIDLQGVIWVQGSDEY